VFGVADRVQTAPPVHTATSIIAPAGAVNSLLEFGPAAADAKADAQPTHLSPVAASAKAPDAKVSKLVLSVATSTRDMYILAQSISSEGRPSSYGGAWPPG
jgi:hypothetical protein